MRRYLLAAVTSGVWLLLLVVAGASWAAVSITRSQVVISLRGASAIVARDPFRPPDAPLSIHLSP